MSGIISRFVIPDPQSFYGTLTVTVDLTLYNGTDIIPAGPAYSKYADLPSGGAADLFGTLQSPSGTIKLRKSGEVIAVSVADLQTQADALRSLKGKQGKLYLNMNDGSTRWAYARCEEVLMPRAAEHTLYLPVDLHFTQLDANWRGEHHGGADGVAWTFDSGVYFDTSRAFDELTGDTFALTSGSPGSTTVTLLNGGNAPATKVRLRIKAGSAAITAVTIQNLAVGVSLQYIPTAAAASVIAAGETLVIDSGTRQVVNGATKDYAGLSLLSGHVWPGWFVIPPSGSSYDINITGGGAGATLAVVYDDGWV